jgi:NAD(P)-dependent dehydrogenase (short-subunit alcohol dehydrogenase family)
VASVQLDVTDRAQVAALWDKVPAELRVVDVLGGRRPCASTPVADEFSCVVNNAGGAHGVDRVGDISDADIATMFAVRLSSTRAVPCHILLLNAFADQCLRTHSDDSTLGQRSRIPVTHRFVALLSSFRFQGQAVRTHHQYWVLGRPRALRWRQCLHSREACRQSIHRLPDERTR